MRVLTEVYTKLKSVQCDFFIETSELSHGVDAVAVV